MNNVPIREVSSIHRSTLTELFDALSFLSDHEEWYNRNPEITITQDAFPKESFTARIVLDWRDEEEDGT